MPSSRPRGTGAAAGAGAAPQRVPPGTPMSERQQMALLMQLTSQTNQAAQPSTGTASANQSPARSRERNERGETALHVAAIKGDQEQVKKLLDQGVDPDVADFAGWTPLHEACSHGWYNIVVTLVRAGANVNARGLDDDTPLHDAANNGQLKIVKFLVESGADVTIKNKKGKVPYDVSVPPVNTYLGNLKENSVIQRSPHGARGATARDDSNKKASAPPAEDPPSSSSSSSVLSSGSAAPASAAMDPVTGKQQAAPADQDKPDADSSLGGAAGGASTDKSMPAAASAKSSDSDSAGSTAGSSSGAPSSSQDEAALPAPPATVQGTKRTLAEANDAIDITENVEEDASKRKKRKESESSKESSKPSQQARGGAGRSGIVAGNKPPGPASKTGVPPLPKGSGQSQGKAGSGGSQKSGGGQGGQSKNSSSGSQGKNSSNLQSGAQQKSGSGSQKTQNSNLSVSQGGGGKNATDKKSPCASPKPSSNNEDNDDAKNVDSGGPKVPPLKIVIPGGAGGSGNQQEGDSGSTQRGNAKNRGNSSTLPYIIHLNVENANAEGNDSSSDGSKDDGKRQGSGGEEKATGQRVLRSHRNTDGEKDKGRSSPHSSTHPNSPNNGSGTNKTPPPSYSDQFPEGESRASTSGGGGSSGSSSASGSGGSASSSNSGGNAQSSSSVELHPRKRKIKASKDGHSHQSSSAGSSSHQSSGESHGHPHPQSNPYQQYLNIRKQIECKQRSLFNVQPKPPEGFEDYLMNRCTYMLKENFKQQPIVNPPQVLPLVMKEEYIRQEEERHNLRVQHLIEKEKLVLTKEQEILRVHGKAARALANQAIPFSACTLLKDKEVYNMPTPEQEEKERNSQRSRYNGRLFFSWLQDVDDKWDKVKEAMVRRHRIEAESLHASQKMSWEWKLKENGLCDRKTTPLIDRAFIPMVHVADDFKLLPL